MRVTTVRPYGTEIRTRVHRALEAAGLEIHEEDTIPPGTLDRVAAASIRARAGSVLLVPFHAQRDSEGRRTNGVQLLELLAEQTGDFPWSVIMPVSRYGLPAARALVAGRGIDPPPRAVRERILLVEEEDLESSELPGRIREHVLQWAEQR